MTVLPDGFALASFLSHWFKEHFSRMQSRACSCYAEAMVFFGRSPKNAVLFGKEGGRPCAVATGPPSLGLVQSDLKSDCCEYQDLQSAISHFKCLYSLRSDSCVPSVASQQSWSGKSDRAGLVQRLSVTVPPTALPPPSDWGSSGFCLWSVGLSHVAFVARVAAFIVEGAAD